MITNIASNFKGNVGSLLKVQGLALVVLALMTGCGERAARMDDRDLEHPLVQRALAQKKAGRHGKAIETLQKALEERPELARAHLELGMLFDAPNDDDYVRAIYHYQRYLEKRPETEKRDIIEGLILGARLSYATTLPNQPSGAVEMIANLKRENNLLRSSLRDLERRSGLDGTDSQKSPSASSESNNIEGLRLPNPEPATGEMRFYTVQRNDSLSRIAQKMYGDSGKWNLIYEANKNDLSSPESLQLGQKLVIPDLK